MVASITSRFSATLATNLVKALLGFITGLMLARLFGPEKYGQFAFLLASFLAIRALLEMGTSSAFFTFASQKPQTQRFYFYYVFWLFVQFALPVFVILSIPDEWLQNVWKTVDVSLVVVAFAASFMQQTLWNFIAQLGESQRLTVNVQILNISVAVAHFLAVAVLMYLGLDSLALVYLLIFFKIALALGFALLAWSSKLEFEASVSGAQDGLKQLFGRFFFRLEGSRRAKSRIFGGPN